MARGTLVVGGAAWHDVTLTVMVVQIVFFASLFHCSAQAFTFGEPECNSACMSVLQVSLENRARNESADFTVREQGLCTGVVQKSAAHHNYGYLE